MGNYITHSRWAWAAALAGGAAGLVAAAVPDSGVAAFGFTLATFSVLAASATARRGTNAPAMPLRIAAWLLCLVLVGYLVLGRAFAGLGVGHLRIGEVTLLVFVVATLAAQPWRRARSRAYRPLLIPIALLIAWGIIRSSRSLGSQPPVDVLRDSVIWGYALLALLVHLALSWRSEWLAGLPKRYLRGGGLGLVLVLVLASSAMIRSFVSQSISGISDSPTRLVKFGDLGVHVAGASAFLIVGLDRGATRVSGALRFVAVPLLATAFVIVASQNRGGAVAVVVGIGALLAITRRDRPGFWVVTALVSLTVLALVLIAPSARRSVATSDRVVSLEQLHANALSIFAPEAVEYGNSTRQWRLEWWGAVSDDLTKDPGRFLFGLGYGVDLADRYGFKGSDEGLRSPHNAFVTWFARSGLTGLVLWFAFLYTLFRGLMRAQRSAKDEQSRNLALWLFAYLLAAVINMSFDVYLEGPQGGLWFWALVGIALAVSSDQAGVGDRSNGPASPPPV